jgi:hypothetical protein
MTLYTDTCKIMAVDLLYRLGSNGFHDWCRHFLMVGHYRTYITSSVGHLRVDSVGLLVLWMVAYNGQSIDIVL